MKTLEALASGAAGACALTAVHEAARRAVPHAPRMDVLGMRSIAALMRAAGAEPPKGDGTLHRASLAGDLVSNTAYYALVGLGPARTACGRGLLLGLLAGVGAVALPGPLGLGSAPSSRTAATALMTVAWYAAGGLAAGCAYQALAGEGG